MLYTNANWRRSKRLLEVLTFFDWFNRARIIPTNIKPTCYFRRNALPYRFFFPREMKNFLKRLTTDERIQPPFSPFAGALPINIFTIVIWLEFREFREFHLSDRFHNWNILDILCTLERYVHFIHTLFAYLKFPQMYKNPQNSSRTAVVHGSFDIIL